MEKYNRILIIGCNGSGKTTFARKLSKKLSIKVIHMDSFIWGPNWKLNDRQDATNNIIKEIKNNDKWILEGYINYAPKEILESSDIVIYLNYLKGRILLNQIKRFIKHRNERRDELPEGCEERYSFKHIINTLQGGVKSLIESALKNYPPKKLIIVKSQRELEKLLM